MSRQVSAAGSTNATAQVDPYAHLVGLSPAAKQQLFLSAQAEEVAAAIASSRQALVDLDQRRQQSTEALAHFRQPSTSSTAGAHATAARIPPGSRPWVCLGSTFVQLPAPAVQSMLQRDRTRLDAEISDLRASIKTDVQQLQALAPSQGIGPDELRFAMSSSSSSSSGKAG